MPAFTTNSGMDCAFFVYGASPAQRADDSSATRPRVVDAEAAANTLSESSWAATAAQRNEIAAMAATFEMRRRITAASAARLSATADRDQRFCPPRRTPEPVLSATADEIASSCPPRRTVLIANSPYHRNLSVARTQKNVSATPRLVASRRCFQLEVMQHALGLRLAHSVDQLSRFMVVAHCFRQSKTGTNAKQQPHRHVPLYPEVDWKVVDSDCGSQV